MKTKEALCEHERGRQKNHRKEHNLKNSFFASICSCCPQMSPMGITEPPGDASRCGRTGEHHHPAQQLSSLVAAGGIGCFPIKAFFFSIGMEAWRHARKLKTTMRFSSGKMPLAKELNSLLHLQAEILPGTLFMLNEDLGGGWPVRMWDVQSSDFHWY